MLRSGNLILIFFRFVVNFTIFNIIYFDLTVCLLKCVISLTEYMIKVFDR